MPEATLVMAMDSIRPDDCEAAEPDQGCAAIAAMDRTPSPGGPAHEADAAAARAVLAGDRAAFSHFITCYQRPLFAVLLRLAPRREDAEDLLQETLLKAFRALAQWDPRRPCLPWLYQIARNAAADAGRRRSARVIEVPHPEPGAGEAPPPEPPDPAADGQRLRERLDARQRLEALRAGLAELSPEDAALFHLHYAEHRPPREIAERLGLRGNTLNVRLHRLRQRLRALLSGEEESR